MGAFGAKSSFSRKALTGIHDRHFVSRLGTRILELSSAGPRLFNGTYDDFLERFGTEHLQR